MLKIIISIALIISASVSADIDDHYHLTKKIAGYMLAFERCEQIVTARGQPGKKILEEIAQYQSHSVERFLFARSFILRKECEKPELAELALTLLIYDELELQPKTRDAIAAIKILAFPSQYRDFERIYAELPQGLKNDLEKMDYFQQPFDGRLVLDALENFW